MPATLPVDVLRSFVAIVDYGSMLKASERVFLTQSALSLQVKRLEEMLQQPLFHRDGRRLVLAPAGETLLGYAREILAINDQAISAVSGGALDGPVRVGMVQDFAETLLTEVLAQFSALHPDTALHARIGGTLELLDDLEKDRMDLLIGFSEPGSPAQVRVEPMIWIGDARLAARQIAPLAVLEKPPPTVAWSPLAMLPSPPPTVAAPPLAVFDPPPPTVAAPPLTRLFKPPETVAMTPLATF